MADIHIDYHFSGGEMLAIEVHAEAEHPDSLDQLTTRAIACFRQALTELTTSSGAAEQ